MPELLNSAIAALLGAKIVMFGVAARVFARSGKPLSNVPSCERLEVWPINSVRVGVLLFPPCAEAMDAAATAARNDLNNILLLERQAMGPRYNRVGSMKPPKEELSTYPLLL